MITAWITKGSESTFYRHLKNSKSNGPNNLIQHTGLQARGVPPIHFGAVYLLLLDIHLFFPEHIKKKGFRKILNYYDFIQRSCMSEQDHPLNISLLAARRQPLPYPSFQAVWPQGTVPKPLVRRRHPPIYTLASSTCMRCATLSCCNSTLPSSSAGACPVRPG
jgi:hypothetical protein